MRFERTRSASQASAPHPCPDCASEADRVLPSKVAFTFNQETVGVGPQNTGVASVDYDVDRVIGKDAQKRWAAYAQRDRRKSQILSENPTKTRKDLSVVEVDGDIDYRVMSSEERSSTRNTRAFHNLAKGLKNATNRYEMLQDLSKRKKS